MPLLLTKWAKPNEIFYHGDMKTQSFAEVI